MNKLLLFIIKGICAVVLFFIVLVIMTESLIAGVIVIVAMATFGYAIWKRNIARREKSLQFISEYNNSQIVVKGYDIIRALEKKKNDDDKQSFVVNVMEHDSEKRADVLGMLNKLEVFAMEIEAKIYDEKIAQKALEGEMRTVYRTSKPFIDYLRDNNEDRDDSFVEYEKLLNKWREGK